MDAINYREPGTPLCRIGASRLPVLFCILLSVLAAIACVKWYDRPDPDRYEGMTSSQWRSVETSSLTDPERANEAKFALHCIDVQKHFMAEQGQQLRTPVAADFKIHAK